MRTGQTKSIESKGVLLALEWLRRKGFHPKDVSDEHRGYDILVGRRRIEVKASTKTRGWNNVDIRKSCSLKWRTPNRRAEIARHGLPFDELIEVTHLGSARPQIYHYPAKVVRSRGELHFHMMWHFQLPEEERERFRSG